MCSSHAEFKDCVNVTVDSCILIPPIISPGSPIRKFGCVYDTNGERILWN